MLALFIHLIEKGERNRNKILRPLKLKMHAMSDNIFLPLNGIFRDGKDVWYFILA